eukprot:Skav228145  [mRNA]  locus=scaffold2683:76253:80064:+ [translate_table: standard]
MPRIWSLAATLIVSPLAYRPTDESILQEEAHVAFDQLWWSRCPSTKSSGIVTDFLKFVPPTCEKSLENIWCDLHKFAKNPKNKDFLKSMGPEQWAQSIAESLFSGGPDVSDGRLFLPPGQKGQEYGRLLVLGDKREATKEIGGIELSELEVNKYWSRRIPLGHKFKLQPELRNCPIFVATSIWKTAAKWALAAYNNIGADLLVNYGKLQTAAGSTMSSLPGLIWEVDGRCTQDERGCVETVAVEPGEPVECTLWLIQGHEGEALHDASVDALSHCEPKRQGPLRASSSLSMLRYHKVAQHALYIHVNATLKTMRSGILNIFWEFERPQISSQPPIAGIQVFSYPGGEKCNELMPALRKSWEERGEDSTNWRLVRFLACHDLGPYEEKGQQERKPFPEGKIFRKPFEPCTTMANIANKDWAQGVFLAEDRDEDTHCLNLTRQLPNFKIVMASQPLKSEKKNKKWQVVERALTNNPFVEGLVLLGVGLTDETLKNLTAAMLEGSKRFIFGQNQGALKQHAEKNSRKLRRRSVYSKPNRRKWSLYLHGNCVTNVHDALEPLLNDHVTLTELTLNEEFLDPSVVESTMGDLGNMRKNGLSKFTSHCPQDMRQTHSKWCPHWKKGHNLQESLEGIKKMKGPMITVRKGILKTKRSMRFTYDINNQSNFELLQDREIRAIWSGGKIDPEECKSKKEKTNWWSSWRKPGNWSFWRKKNK